MRAKPAAIVECSRCRGSGKTELTGAYADALSLLRKQSEEINGSDLALLAGVKSPAMNNRLVWLEAHGLILSRANGRERLWRAK